LVVPTEPPGVQVDHDVRVRAGIQENPTENPAVGGLDL